MASILSERLLSTSIPGSVSLVAVGAELRKSANWRDAPWRIAPLEKRPTSASLSAPTSRGNKSRARSVTPNALASESFCRRRSSRGNRGLACNAAEGSSGSSSDGRSASVGLVDSGTAEQPGDLPSADNGTSSSQQGASVADESSPAAARQEAGASAPAAAKPNSGNAPYFPLPSFMAEQAAAEAASLAVAPAESEAEAEARTKRKAPTKLALSDKASAPWGWEPGASREGAPLGALEQWLRGKGLPEQKLTLSLVKEGGRGLVATKDIGKGEALLFVPSQLMMTAEEVRHTPGAPPAGGHS